MTALTAILETIRQYDTIIIHRHQKPDPDALGSQVGLATLLRHHFPEKRILTTGVDEPSLAFMASMDKVEDQDYLNSLVIVTDTANLARIDDARYQLGVAVIKIDHHPNDEPYGDLCYVDTTASSCSEIIVEFALATGLDLTAETARLLYAGIVGDTGRFLYPNTTAKTLELASRLRTYDFDAALLARQMDAVPLAIAKLMGYLLEHLIIDPSGAAKAVISQNLLNRLGVRAEEVSLLVGLPGKIDCVDRWMICTEQADGAYRVNLRSKDHVINQLAKEHHGGGHPLASGAWAYSLEEIDTIYDKLKALSLAN